MPRPTFHPSRNPIILIAVVERDPSLQLKHLITPNLPSNHPTILAAQAALSSAPDFIFPPHLPSPQFSPPPIHSPTPSPFPTPPQSPNKTPTHLPLSSSAAYFALAHPTKSPRNASRRPPSRTFSNLSSLNNFFPSTPTILRRPSSSPSQHSSHPPSPHPSSDSHQHPCRPALESANRLFRTTFLSCPAHVFAITAKDGSRSYAYCRPLSSTTAVLLLSSASHTSVYVSALERTAVIYHNLVEQAITNLTLTTSPCVCSIFIATNINRCPKHIATNLAGTLLAFFNCPAFASPNHVCHYPHNPILSSSSISSSPFPSYPQHPTDSLTDLDEFSAPCLISSPSALLKSQTVPPEPHLSVHESTSILDNRLTTHPDACTSVCPVNPKVQLPDFSMKRVVELADATLLLRHFSIRSLLSIIVALLEERRVCFVGSNTALVSRTVLAIDNFIRPFEWPHLISPVLLAHMLPVLSAPFPYLVGILEDHFANTSQLPLEDVVFADISTGKVTTVEGPGELYRHIPRRIRGRLERRLTRAKISCTRQVLRSRPSVLSNASSNTLANIADLSDDAGFSNNKKDKPNLMKRSRSYARFNEASPHNIWLEHETTLIIDKAMQKFFADLLDGYTDTRDSAILNKDDEVAREGFGQILPQMAPVSLTSRNSSRRERDSDKNQLVNAFQNTQMFMQWRDLALQESLTPFRLSETRSQRGVLSRKRSKDRDSSAKKSTTDADEDNVVKNPKFKVRIASDMEDAFDGERGGARLDNGVERKRFRSKRKSSRRQGVRLQLALDEPKHDSSSLSLTSDAVGSDVSTNGVSLQTAPEADAPGRHPQIGLSGADLDVEYTARRPWFSLRLPSTTWSTAKEWTTLAAQERTTSIDRYDQTSDGEETDPFDEVEESTKFNDISQAEDAVGAGWSRMRQWSKRMNKRSARV